MKLNKLNELMTDLGFEKVEDPGFEAYVKGEQKVLFFLWSSRKHAALLGVPRASLVIRIGSTSEHIPLVEWPSEWQSTRQWSAVVEDIRAYLAERIDI